MSREQKKIYRYSNCFKEQVVREISSGSSITEVCRRYDIRGTSTVQEVWTYRIVKYGNVRRERHL